MKIKICGVTTEADARMVAAHGADFIGLNFWPFSPRHVSLVRAIDLANAARDANPDIGVVGVFVDQSTIEIEYIDECVNLDYVQLHGNEPNDQIAYFGERVIKAYRPTADDWERRLGEISAEIVLIDSVSPQMGGSGLPANWTRAHLASSRSGKKVVLAGGLNPDNVIEAISEVAPWAIDVASGVERRPGEKDEALVGRFIERARGQGL